MILGLAAGALVLAQSEAGSETWTFDRLDSINGYTVSLLGQPRIVETPLGKAVQFDGEDDAMWAKR